MAKKNKEVEQNKQMYSGLIDASIQNSPLTIFLTTFCGTPGMSVPRFNSCSTA